MKRSFFVLCAVISAAAVAAACGGGGGSTIDDEGGVGNDGGLLGDGDPLNPNNKQITSVTVDPPSATLTLVNDQIVTQPFNAIVHYADNTQETVTNNSAWSATNPQVGKIDGAGLYTPSADVGGVVTIGAAYKNFKGTAQLTVKLTYQRNPANLGMNEQTALKNASTPDGKVVWAYPYDKTVFPRGLGAPPLEWNGGGANDVYFVHVESPTYDLQTFTTVPPPSRFSFPDVDWRKFVDSTTGGAKLTVARWDGQNATVVAAHGWTIAPQSMRGTIYYWANNLGRVMRIKPGATSPDDFAYKAPLNDPNKYVQSSCLMTCHTVSADGSTLISGGGTFGGSYDLKQDAVRHYTGGNWGGNGSWWNSVMWANPAVSPEGKYILVNSQSVRLASQGNPSTPNNQNFRGLYDTTTGAAVPNSGLDQLDVMSPAWSPTGDRIVYVASGNPFGWTWDNVAPGDLRALDFNGKNAPMASNDRLIVSYGGNASQKLFWPTIGPDGDFVVYQRGTSSRTDGNQTADLYGASISNPGKEVALDALNGKSYPFAAGARDLHWNFEPAFAPVAAGGYFWVVFTSRRTYGNELTGAASATKQLWVAAIDQKPQPGVDPSHPPFRLPGQAINSINMRGYWALDPCKGDGQGCTSGTECCGGYCDMAPADGGGPVCKSTKNGCSDNGDKCDVTSDCCNAASGVTCINHVCSEPPPK